MGGSKMSAPGQGEGLRLHDLWVRNHRLRWGVKGRRGPGSRPSSWEQSLPEASTLDFPKQEWNRWVVPWGVGGQVIQGTLVLHVLVKTIQFSLVAQSCPTLCDSMNCSMPDLPVHHQLPELTQTHVHQVGDAIKPSHPLSSPSPTFNFSQHQGLFQWVSSHQVAKVLELQLQHQFFQWIFWTDLL